MQLVEIIQKSSETHRKYPDSHHGLERCVGCPWIGYHHGRHQAEEIAAAIRQSRLIEDVDQLSSITSPNALESGGALIKSFNNDPSNQLFEQNRDSSWCVVGRPDDNLSWSDRDLGAGDVPLPVILLWRGPDDQLWQPSRQQ